MQTWQRALLVALIFICVATGLVHKVEAAIETGHSEHCSVCITGSSNPPLAQAMGTPGLNFNNVITSCSMAKSFVQHGIVSAYITRAPPLA